MYLFDTMVLSESFKSSASSAVLNWIKSIKGKAVYVSVISIGEMQRGVRKMESTLRTEPSPYRIWLETALRNYSGRILPVTLAIARRWGPLTYDLKNTGPDLLIAATALEHGLIVATRNTRQFAPTGVTLFNPYEA